MIRDRWVFTGFIFTRGLINEFNIYDYYLNLPVSINTYTKHDRMCALVSSYSLIYFFLFFIMNMAVDVKPMIIQLKKVDIKAIELKFQIKPTKKEMTSSIMLNKSNNTNLGDSGIFFFLNSTSGLE